MSVLLVILKILLYTVGGIAALLLLLLLVKIKVELVYVEYFSAEVRALGLRLFYYELKEKDGGTEREEHVKKKKKKEGKDSSDQQKKEGKKKSVKEIINEFKSMVFELIDKFKKHLRLERLDVKALISTEDAARTALVYSEVCAAGACIAEYARNIKNSKKDCVHVKIVPDFIAEKCDLDLRFAFSMRIIFILSVVYTIRKMMKKAKENNL